MDTVELLNPNEPDAQPWADEVYRLCFANVFSRSCDECESPLVNEAKSPSRDFFLRKCLEIIVAFRSAKERTGQTLFRGAKGDNCETYFCTLP